jgi:hypothetical protein
MKIPGVGISIHRSDLKRVQFEKSIFEELISSCTTLQVLDESPPSPRLWRGKFRWGEIWSG